MYLVIDTCVWESAQNGDASSIDILCKILLHPDHVILVNMKGDILNEYRAHIREPVLIRLFTQLSRSYKIRYRPRTPLKIKNFDPNDVKFVEVANSTPNTILVTVDSDYDVFRQLQDSDSRLRLIRIMTPADAILVL
jgi:predicted nucleic acid-binding protein